MVYIFYGYQLIIGNLLSAAGAIDYKNKYDTIEQKNVEDYL